MLASAHFIHSTYNTVSPPKTVFYVQNLVLLKMSWFSIFLPSGNVLCIRCIYSFTLAATLGFRFTSQSNFNYSCFWYWKQQLLLSLPTSLFTIIRNRVIGYGLPKFDSFETSALVLKLFLRYWIITKSVTRGTWVEATLILLFWGL